LLGALKRADELFGQLKNASPDLLEHPSMRDCQAALLSIRGIYPYYSNNLMKAGVLNAISDVQSELGRLADLVRKYISYKYMGIYRAISAKSLKSLGFTYDKFRQ